MTLNIWLWSHFQTALLIFALLFHTPLIKRYPKIFATLILFFTIWPLWNDLDICSYLLPITGFLSVTSLTLLTNYVIKNFYDYNLLSSAEHSYLFNILIILGLILYPATLGWLAYDPYSWGFTGIILPISLSSGAAVAWKYQYYKLAILTLAAIWIWLLNLSASQNLWDYVIDPWLLLYSVYQIITNKKIGI